MLTEPIQSDGITASTPIVDMMPAPGVFAVRMLKIGERKRGNIIVVEGMGEVSNQGIVVYAGESTYTKGLSFLPKIGDRVAIKRFGGAEIFVNNEWLNQVGANDITAVLISEKPPCADAEHPATPPCNPAADG
jgi:co-chaperonin GroES (HSP10)